MSRILVSQLDAIFSLLSCLTSKYRNVIFEFELDVINSLLNFNIFRSWRNTPILKAIVANAKKIDEMKVEPSGKNSELIKGSQTNFNL